METINKSRNFYFFLYLNTESKENMSSCIIIQHFYSDCGIISLFPNYYATIINLLIHSFFYRNIDQPTKKIYVISI